MDDYFGRVDTMYDLLQSMHIAKVAKRIEHQFTILPLGRLTHVYSKWPPLLSEFGNQI